VLLDRRKFPVAAVAHVVEDRLAQAQFLECSDGLVLVGGASVSLVLDLRIEELLEEGARVDVLLEQLGFGRFGWDEGRRHRLERVCN